MEYVIFLENRGAIVNDPVEFFQEHKRKGKGRRLNILPLKYARNLEVHEFRCTFRGATSWQWAWMWLKGQGKARQAGAPVPVPTLRRETVITSQACKKAFRSEIAQKNSLRKKSVKMIAVQGSWFLDSEIPVKGLGAYRP